MNQEKEIESWLKNEMTAAEKADFERRLALDEDLRAATEAHQKLMLDLRDIGLRRRVRTAAEANQRLIFRRRMLFLLLAVLVLAIAGVLVFRQNRTSPLGQNQDSPAQPSSPEKQTSPGEPEIQSPKPEIRNLQNPATPEPQNSQTSKPSKPIAQNPPSQNPGEPIFRDVTDASVDSTRLPLFAEFFDNYRPALTSKGSFSKAARLLETGKTAEAQAALLPFSQNDTARYLLAVAALKLRQPEKAAPFLTALYRPDCVFRPEAEWLLALGWVLQGRDELAERSLRSVFSNSGHPRRLVAGEVLGKLTD